MIPIDDKSAGLPLVCIVQLALHETMMTAAHDAMWCQWATMICQQQFSAFWVEGGFLHV